ncbi:MAG: SH3 domain-containing protein [Rhizobiaceae bacterium]
MKSLFRIVLTASLSFASAAAFLPAPSNAAVFAAWEVANVKFGDVLNVRKYPSNESQIQAGYQNGTVLQMTGRCKGGTPNLLDIAHLPEWKQEQLVRYRWCEVWHDPMQNGKYVTGWVYGRYISPAD